MAKYRNIKYRGYDSIREYNRAQRLKMMQNAGLISNLSEQVKYELIPAQYETIETGEIGRDGKIKTKRRCTERAVTYRADFQYTKDGETVVEDSKGFRTEEYKIKRKLMLYMHGIKIKEV